MHCNIHHIASLLMQTASWRVSHSCSKRIKIINKINTSIRTSSSVRTTRHMIPSIHNAAISCSVTSQDSLFDVSCTILIFGVKKNQKCFQPFIVTRITLIIHTKRSQNKRTRILVLQYILVPFRPHHRWVMNAN